MDKELQELKTSEQEEKKVTKKTLKKKKELIKCKYCNKNNCRAFHWRKLKREVLKNKNCERKKAEIPCLQIAGNDLNQCLLENKCPYCKSGEISAISIIEHVAACQSYLDYQKKYEKTVDKSTICGLCFQTSIDRKYHNCILKWNNLCQFCGLITTSFKDLLKHESKCEVHKKYKSICEGKSETEHTCEDCLVVFSTKTDLDTHDCFMNQYKYFIAHKKVKRKEEYSCKKHFKKFESYFSFKSHIMIKHSKILCCLCKKMIDTKIYAKHKAKCCLKGVYEVFVKRKKINGKDCLVCTCRHRELNRNQMVFHLKTGHQKFIADISKSISLVFGCDQCGHIYGKDIGKIFCNCQKKYLCITADKETNDAEYFFTACEKGVEKTVNKNEENPQNNLLNNVDSDTSVLDNDKSSMVENKQENDVLPNDIVDNESNVPETLSEEKNAMAKNKGIQKIKILQNVKVTNKNTRPKIKCQKLGMPSKQAKRRKLTTNSKEVVKQKDEKNMEDFKEVNLDNMFFSTTKDAKFPIAFLPYRKILDFDIYKLVYKCALCHYESDDSLRSKHNESHEGKAIFTATKLYYQYYQCTECEVKFYSFFSIRQHIEMMHLNMSNISVGYDIERNFILNVLKMPYEKQDILLTNHCTKHIFLKTSYKCSSCAYIQDIAHLYCIKCNVHNIMGHILENTHAVSDSYLKCNECGKHFKDSLLLFSHFKFEHPGVWGIEIPKPNTVFPRSLSCDDLSKLIREQKFDCQLKKSLGTESADFDSLVYSHKQWKNLKKCRYCDFVTDSFFSSGRYIEIAHARSHNEDSCFVHKSFCFTFYRCKSCDVSYNLKALLIHFKMVHPDVQLFQPNIKNAFTIENDNAVNHVSLVKIDLPGQQQTMPIKTDMDIDKDDKEICMVVKYRSNVTSITTKAKKPSFSLHKINEPVKEQIKITKQKKDSIKMKENVAKKIDISSEPCSSLAKILIAIEKETNQNTCPKKVDHAENAENSVVGTMSIKDYLKLIPNINFDSLKLDKNAFSLLIDSMNEVTQVEIYKEALQMCDICNCIKKTKKDLYLHFKENHPTKFIKFSPTNENFVCLMCDKFFGIKALVRHYILVHTIKLVEEETSISAETKTPMEYSVEPESSTMNAPDGENTCESVEDKAEDKAVPFRDGVIPLKYRLKIIPKSDFEDIGTKMFVKNVIKEFNTKSKCIREMSRKYKCPHRNVCQFSTKSEDTMISHVKTRHDCLCHIDPGQCIKHCNNYSFTFSTRVATSYMCEMHPGKKWNHIGALITHMADQHAIGTYNISKTTNFLWKKYIMTFLDNKRVIPMEKKKKSKKFFEVIYKCKICQKIENKWWTKHILEHSEYLKGSEKKGLDDLKTPIYVCMFCGEQFFEMTFINGHIQTVHWEAYAHCSNAECHNFAIFCEKHHPRNELRLLLKDSVEEVMLQREKRIATAQYVRLDHSYTKSTDDAQNNIFYDESTDTAFSDENTNEDMPENHDYSDEHENVQIKDAVKKPPENIFDVDDDDEFYENINEENIEIKEEIKIEPPPFYDSDQESEYDVVDIFKDLDYDNEQFDNELSKLVENGYPEDRTERNFPCPDCPYKTSQYLCLRHHAQRYHKRSVAFNHEIYTI